MKDAAVQNSAAHSATVNSPLNDSGRVDALLSQHEPNAERWGAAALEQRRANAGSSGKNCCWSRDLDGTEQVLLWTAKPASFFVGPQKQVLSVRRLCQAKRTQLLDPGSWAHHPATDRLNP